MRNFNFQPMRTCIGIALLLCVPMIAAAVDLSQLSNADASAGLRKALSQGVDKAVSELGVVDGFLKNPKVKIDLPPKLAVTFTDTLPL